MSEKNQEDFGFLPKRKVNIKSAKPSYGIILFNNEGKFCAIRNEFSYSFCSFINALKNQEFLNFEELYQEFKDKEAEIILANWTKTGIVEILKWYEQKLGLSKTFDPFLAKIKKKWTSIIDIVDKTKLKERKPRYWDLPKAKGPENKKWNVVTNIFLEDVGCAIPSDVKLGRWLSVNYCAKNSVQYNMEFIVAKTGNFNLPNQKAQWIAINEQNFVPEILDVLVKAKSLSENL